jgi:ribosomal protection tetracycline resistance protein
MRALQRLKLPVLFFVNKIDRSGADPGRVLRAIEQRLTPAVISMGATSALGTHGAGFTPWAAADAAFLARLTEALAEHDEDILAAYVQDDAGVPYSRLRRELAAQTRGALVHPVFFGSAITGAGIAPLMAALGELLPTAAGDPDGPVSGQVFKIERGASSEKIAYVRMFSGTLRTRDRLSLGGGRDGKVTAISVIGRDSACAHHRAAGSNHALGRDSAVQDATVSAGEIARLRGLTAIQVGDRISPPSGGHVPGRQPAGCEPPGGQPEHQFGPPTLESVVVPARPGDRGRLRAAIGQLAEQDPLINVRQDDTLGEMSVSLYGEVQSEVIQATLASDFGLDVTFRETTVIHVERLAGSGAALEVINTGTHPFLATLGLRVEPGPAGSGVVARLDVDIRLVPLYVYKTADAFAEMMAQYAAHALREGLHGWPVNDCLVTVTDCGYASPVTGAADFRKLTPLVLMAAVRQAGTVVCQPMIRAALEIPADTIGAVLTAAARLGGIAGSPSVRSGLALAEIMLPAARAQDLTRQLPGLTSGEGVIETSFGGYRPLRGVPPVRARTMPDPLNREEYLLRLTRRGGDITG